MERKMIKQKRKLSDEETLELLNNGQYGVLATVDKDNQPYGVPISYVLFKGSIYCHCALAGYKLENIKNNEKVSFTVVGKTEPVFEGVDFSTYYESAIVIGKAKIVEDKEEKIESLRALCEKYLPEYMEHFQDALDAELVGTCVFKISMDSCTGKAKRK